MATNSISNDLYLSSSKVTYTTSNNNGALDKDAFLKILITQLQNQDPTDPMDDKDFIAQMAQFSSLEQMQNMTKAITELVSSQQQTQLMSYTSFIGKEVKWDDLTDKLDEKGQQIVESGKGIITEVKFVDGQPSFTLDNGKVINAGNISSVFASATQNTPVNDFAQASELIGQLAKYTDDNGDVVEAVIEAIGKKNNVVEYILANQTRLTKDQFEIVKDEQ